MLCFVMFSLLGFIRFSLFPFSGFIRLSVSHLSSSECLPKVAESCHFFTPKLVPITANYCHFSLLDNVSLTGYA